VSDALEKWKDERAEALNSLDAIHGKVTGRRRGRKYNTKHLKWNEMSKRYPGKTPKWRKTLDSLNYAPTPWCLLSREGEGNAGI
jgi:hypothetical protein